MSAVTEALTEEEMALACILMDPSGIDQAEFLWTAHENDDNCFRAWPFQWAWWRDSDPLQINQSSRSVGKSLGIKVRIFAFPFAFPGQEAVVTAPELVHLEPICQLIEQQFETTRLGREMRRKPPTHRPFMMEFLNGSRIIGRIPQRDGKGVKGIHPLILEQDEACFAAGTLILTQQGLVPIEAVEVGDLVLTHRNRWRPVVHTHSYERPTINVSGHGCPNLEVTTNHRFWIKDVKERDWRKRDGARKFEDPQWIRASDAVGAFWSCPAEFPPTPIPACEAGSSRQQRHDVTSDAFGWVLGLYLAEGSTCSGYGRGGPLTKTYFSIHRDEVPEVEERLHQAGLKCSVDYFSNSAGANVYVSSRSLAEWFARQVSSGARNKQLPIWVLGQSHSYRAAVLDGLLFGDGCESSDPRYAKGRHRLSTTSQGLAVTARFLGASLDFHTNLYHKPVPAKASMIRGREVLSGDSYEVIFATKGQGHWDDGKTWTKVKAASPAADFTTVYDLEVESDHSFVANGIVVHNSDYPEAGWKELVETLKRGQTGAMWHSSGVTRGMRDSFYKFSQHGQDDPPLRPVRREGKWTVHRIVAMCRPNWTDLERQEKIMQYGSKDDPDYRRNVIGSHGDSQSPLFVTHRLMRVVDDDPSSDYNQDEYWHFEIKDTELDRKQADILDLLIPPSMHSQYKTVWIGMDVGFVQDPTEILIAAEYAPSAAELKEAKAAGKIVPAGGTNRLKMIGRVTLKRISEPAQADVIVALIDHYKPQAFAMDSTGVGLPLFQQVQRRMEDHADQIQSARARRAAESIRGYNFSSKILVDFDETIEMDERSDLDDKIKEAGIMRNVLEVSTDIARSYVDEGRLWLPWDTGLIDEMRGQNFVYSKSERDAYGRRRIFSSGSFHALDALRMLVLGHKQNTIEALLKEKPETPPVIDIFMEL